MLSFNQFLEEGITGPYGSMGRFNPGGRTGTQKNTEKDEDSESVRDAMVSSGQKSVKITKINSTINSRQAQDSESSTYGT